MQIVERLFWMWIPGRIKVTISSPTESLKWISGIAWIWRMTHWRTIRGDGLMTFVRCSAGYFFFALPPLLPSLPYCTLCPRRPTGMDRISGIPCFVVARWIWQPQIKRLERGTEARLEYLFHRKWPVVGCTLLSKTPILPGTFFVQLLFLGYRNYSLSVPLQI